jgi:hypothetical protein
LALKNISALYLEEVIEYAIWLMSLLAFITAFPPPSSEIEISLVNADAVIRPSPLVHTMHSIVKRVMIFFFMSFTLLKIIFLGVFPCNTIAQALNIYRKSANI